MMFWIAIGLYLVNATLVTVIRQASTSRRAGRGGVAAVAAAELRRAASLATHFHSGR